MATTCGEKMRASSPRKKTKNHGSKLDKEIASVLGDEGFTLEDIVTDAMTWLVTGKEV